jgi:hypothetical protein
MRHVSNFYTLILGKKIHLKQAEKRFTTSPSNSSVSARPRVTRPYFGRQTVAKKRRSSGLQCHALLQMVTSDTDERITPSSTLKMEAIRSSETLVTTKNTPRYHNSEHHKPKSKLLLSYKPKVLNRLSNEIPQFQNFD